MIKLVLFDLDETLYDERSYVLSGFHVIAATLAKRHGLSGEAVFQALVRSLDEDGRGKNFDRVLEQLGVEHENVPRLVRIYRNHKPDIRLFEDAERALTMLRSRVRIGIITDGNRIMQKNKVQALHLRNYVHFIIYTDHKGLKEKPDSSSFKKALAMAKAAPEETVYFGDHPYKDIAGAKRLGLKTIRVNRGAFKDIEIGGGGQADHLVSTLDEISFLFEPGLINT
jgi:putative hydrolase of the HAD superfamily